MTAKLAKTNAIDSSMLNHPGSTGFLELRKRDASTTNKCPNYSPVAIYHRMEWRRKTYYLATANAVVALPPKNVSTKSLAPYKGSRIRWILYKPRILSRYRPAPNVHSITVKNKTEKAYKK